MVICYDQLVSSIILQVLLNYHIFIPHNVRIISDYVNFKISENVKMKSLSARSLNFSPESKNQLWVPSSFVNQFVTYK